MSDKITGENMGWKNGRREMKEEDLLYGKTENYFIYVIFFYINFPSITKYTLKFF